MSDAHSNPPLDLLNIYEFEEDGQSHHVVAFMDPVLAGSIGLASHAVLGEFTPDPNGEFNPDSFEVNAAFIEVLTEFMNNQPAQSTELQLGAQQSAGQPLFLADPRCTAENDEEPETEDVIGHFMVDENGEIVPNSFHYNPEHCWFSRRSGVSGLLSDRSLYEFLHPQARVTHGLDPEHEAP